MNWHNNLVLEEYRASRIYKIYSPTTGCVFVGMASTKKPLNTFLNDYLRRTFSLRGLKKDDSCIELIENYPCDNRYYLGLRCDEINRQLQIDGHNVINPKKFNCECGGTYLLAKHEDHCSTKKHKAYEYRIKIIESGLIAKPAPEVID